MTTYNNGKFKSWRRKHFFRLKKELNYTWIKNIRNLLRLEKETKIIKNRILKNIKNLFEHEEEENCYTPIILIINN